MGWDDGNGLGWIEYDCSSEEEGCEMEMMGSMGSRLAAQTRASFIERGTTCQAADWLLLIALGSDELYRNVYAGWLWEGVER
jgi:hypothetical protein